MENCSKYAHSPAHLAVARRDYDALKLLISELPQLAKAGEVNTEAESIKAELVADAVSAVLDRRDVPGRETPLFLAVRLRDPTSVEYLMAAGADWSLQNENGWCALQEAVCAREESIALIISRHYQPFAWAKWCRRLPRIVASAKRVRDFYMEITFHFESSMIPFIGRIAPSDTYRIWKRGSNLRADLTLAGFDGFHILRTDQSFLFLGDGYSSEDGKICLPKGSLVVLYHKEKEATSALEGAGAQPTEAEVAREVASMFRTNMYRSGIDVTQAELVPQLNWRRQERTEMVGNWKAKVYEMLHVMLHVKTRHVPGVTTGERIGNGSGNVDYSDGFTTEERLNLDSPREMLGNVKKGKDRSSKKKKKKGGPSESKLESEFKKGLRPNLWLTPDFPLKIDELLPLLDILANKVKAVRRLRELLTTKLPPGTFPVKVAIPIVPTVRVLVTFTKFEELQPTKEFLTPPSSPRHFQDSRSKESEGSTSWVSWMKGNRGVQSSNGENRSRKDDINPFHIPSDYSWIDVKEKKSRIKAMRAKSKSQETN